MVPPRSRRPANRRIIDFCKSIESKGLDPFLVEVKDLIAVIKEYFPRWTDPDDLSLDAEAINQVASVIKLQSEWIKHRSSSLYRDPFLIEEKIRAFPIAQVTEIFLESWHPIVEFEQLSAQGLGEAIKYWNGLLPLNERWQNTNFTWNAMGTATHKDLILQGILLNETFSSEMEKMWVELKEAVRETEKIRYWDFVATYNYDETVRRAYLASFLVTYGYATLEIHPLEEKIFIKPNNKPISKKEKQSVSFPISVSFEEWKKWKEKQEA